MEVAGPQKLVVITTTMLTFGMGASTQALFARVGGGIYTKAADVGADLVGEVEAGIPEDDPRNPATIADNVGDNVGDVAGMGADLYESWPVFDPRHGGAGRRGGVRLGRRHGVADQAVLAPMLIAAVGIVLSILGIFLVRTKEGHDAQKLLVRWAWARQRSVSLLGSPPHVRILCLSCVLGHHGASSPVSHHGRPPGITPPILINQTQKIAGSAQTGPATVIIAGIGSGMISTAIPVVTIGVAIILAYLCAIGFDIENDGSDEYVAGSLGIGIAAVGMLSTLGITLATDAWPDR